MDLTYALEEEIGNPALFVGRTQELEYYRKWVELVKGKLAASIALLSRRRKGKTALMQRFYNILYTQNDPQVIPFYIRIPEQKTTQLDFAEQFYLAFINQYLSFKTREPWLSHENLNYEALREWAAGDEVVIRDLNGMENLCRQGKASFAWRHAAYAGSRIAEQKDERIIQILDEFQYMNRYVYADNTYAHQIDLCGTYQHVASLKQSPQIVTGSYVGWLTKIVDGMVGRYRNIHLGGLKDEDAVQAVYNYSSLYRVPVTDETAPLIASIADNDPYYISQMFQSNYEERDLTDPDSVIRTMEYEISVKSGKEHTHGGIQGGIARMWMEYIQYAFKEINDVNAKKIVLYLAKHGDEERNRNQIKEDLKLDMTDAELESRLRKLVYSDLIGRGSAAFRYCGLGDPIFALFFRKEYDEELGAISKSQLDTELKAELRSAMGRVSHYKGLAAEYKVSSRTCRVARWRTWCATIRRRSTWARSNP